MKKRKHTVCLLLALSLVLQSCSTVGKNEPFVKFKTEVSGLKTDTEGALDLTKLDFGAQLKTETLRVANDAGEKSGEFSQAKKDLKTAEKALGKASEALEKVLAGTPPNDDKAKELVRVKDDAEFAVKDARENAENAQVELKRANELLKKRLETFDLQTVATDPFEWGSSSMPSYFRLVQMRAQAVKSMKLAEEYSDLVLQLSSPGLIDETRFQNASDQLNATARKVFSNAGDGVALVSTTAIQSAKLYLRNRQARDLQEFLRKNQSTIDRYAKLMEDGLVIFARNVDRYYSRELDLTGEKIWIPGAAGGTDRATGVGGIITANQQYIAVMENLKDLRTRYRKLPASHLALSKSIISPSLTLEYVNSATDQAAALGGQYERSANRNQYENALLVAKASDETAAQLERSAAEALAETALAKARYDIAVAKSDAAPEDQVKKDNVLDLKIAHLELMAISDGLKAKAAYQRTLANFEKTDAEKLKPAPDPAPAAKKND